MPTADTAPNTTGHSGCGTCTPRRQSRPSTLAEAEERFAELQEAHRRLEAEMAELVGAVDAAGLHRADGHGSVAAWCRASGKWSTREANARRRTGALLSEIPSVADAMFAGRLGVAQAQELARAFHNPRCGHGLVDVIDILLAVAEDVSFDEFCILVRRWENLADVDGAHGRAERSYAGRSATVVNSINGVNVEAHGPLVNGATLAEVFAAFCDAEFAADWDEACRTHGEQAARANLPRTRGQRGFDALCRIFELAANAAPGIRPGEPLVNIHVDADTLAEEIEAMADPDPNPRRHRVAPLDPMTRRCETSDGIPLAPSEVVAAVFAGQVRRVVHDSTGVIIDFGRRRRLFTGAARAAVLQASTHCVWPGCNVPSSRCQADHLTEWQEQGDTNVANAAPLCGRHNRFKSTGYRVYRDDGGQWRTLRPDGSRLG